MSVSIDKGPVAPLPVEKSKVDLSASAKAAGIQTTSWIRLKKFGAWIATILTGSIAYWASRDIRQLIHGDRIVIHGFPFLKQEVDRAAIQNGIATASFPLNPITQKVDYEIKIVPGWVETRLKLDIVPEPSTGDLGAQKLHLVKDMVYDRVLMRTLRSYQVEKTREYLKDLRAETVENLEAAAPERERDYQNAIDQIDVDLRRLEKDKDDLNIPLDDLFDDADVRRLIMKEHPNFHRILAAELRKEIDSYDHLEIGSPHYQEMMQFMENHPERVDAIMDFVADNSNRPFAKDDPNAQAFALTDRVKMVIRNPSIRKSIGSISDLFRAITVSPEGHAERVVYGDLRRAMQDRVSKGYSVLLGHKQLFKEYNAFQKGLANALRKASEEVDEKVDFEGWHKRLQDDVSQLRHPANRATFQRTLDKLNLKRLELKAKLSVPFQTSGSDTFGLPGFYANPEKGFDFDYPDRVGRMGDNPTVEDLEEYVVGPKGVFTQHLQHVLQKYNANREQYKDPTSPIHRELMHDIRVLYKEAAACFQVFHREWLQNPTPEIEARLDGIKKDMEMLASEKGDGSGFEALLHHGVRGFDIDFINAVLALAEEDLKGYWDSSVFPMRVYVDVSDPKLAERRDAFVTRAGRFAEQMQAGQPAVEGSDDDIAFLYEFRNAKWVFNPSTSPSSSSKVRPGETVSRPQEWEKVPNEVVYDRLLDMIEEGWTPANYNEAAKIYKLLTDQSFISKFSVAAKQRIKACAELIGRHGRSLLFAENFQAGITSGMPLWKSGNLYLWSDDESGAGKVGRCEPWEALFLVPRFFKTLDRAEIARGNAIQQAWSRTAENLPLFLARKRDGTIEFFSRETFGKMSREEREEYNLHPDVGPIIAALQGKRPEGDEKYAKEFPPSSAIGLPTLDSIGEDLPSIKRNLEKVVATYVYLKKEAPASKELDAACLHLERLINALQANLNKIKGSPEENQVVNVTSQTLFVDQNELLQLGQARPLSDDVAF